MCCNLVNLRSALNVAQVNHIIHFFFHIKAFQLKICLYILYCESLHKLLGNYLQYIINVIPYINFPQI